MIDIHYSRMIAEEATVAKKALEKLIYCGMRGEMSEKFVKGNALVACECVNTIMRALPIIEEREHTPESGGIKSRAGKIEEELVVKLYSELGNGALVAEKLGVSYRRVYYILCKRGVMKKRGHIAKREVGE